MTLKWLMWVFGRGPGPPHAMLYMCSPQSICAHFCPQGLWLLMTVMMDLGGARVVQGGNWVNVSTGSGSTCLKCLSVCVNENSIDPSVQFCLRKQSPPTRLKSMTAYSDWWSYCSCSDNCINITLGFSFLGFRPKMETWIVNLAFKFVCVVKVNVWGTV